jgi:hypothetical protein
MHAQRSSLLAALGPREGGQAHEGHRDRREHERCADDRSDGDLVGARIVSQNGEHRDRRLGHRGGRPREDRADRPDSEPESTAGPFDRVRKEQRS